MRLGIILTNPAAERKKDEMTNSVYGKKNRPWAAIKTDRKLTLRGPRKSRLLPYDVLIGNYIRHKYPKITVDFIKPGEISQKRLKKNNLNFMMIYDLLEAFHVNGKNKADHFEKILKKSKNIFPPYKYQKLIYNKDMYYKYLEKKKIQVVPTYSINRKKWNINKRLYTKNLLKKMKNDKWNKFIGKPVYGQESKHFKKFNNMKFEPLFAYLVKMMKLYPNVCIQEYVEGFDKENPELRMYFVGNTYKYSIITTNSNVWKLATDLPKRSLRGQSKRRIKKDYKHIPDDAKYKSLAKKTIKVLPDIIIQGVKLPKLLTRIDVASGLEGKSSHFVNEVEFVPSLYMEDHDYLVDKWLGEQMVKILKKFKKRVKSN